MSSDRRRELCIILVREKGSQGRARETTCLEAWVLKHLSSFLPVFGYPLKEIPEGCAAVAVARLLFGAELGKCLRNLRKVK